MPLQSKSCAIWVLTECVFPRVLLCRPVFDFATKPITGIEVPTNQPLCVFLIVLAVWYPELGPSFRSKVSFITFWIASFQCMEDTQKDSGRKKTDSTWMKLNLGLICFQPWHWVTVSLHGPEKQTHFPQDLFHILLSCFSKPWCMHLGRILAVKGIKVGDVITKRCLVRSVRSTREEDKVWSSLRRLSLSDQGNQEEVVVVKVVLEVVVESRTAEGWTCQTTGTKCQPQLP